MKLADDNPPHLSSSLGTWLEPGQEIIVTRLDHDANQAPWLQMAENKGALVLVDAVHYAPHGPIDIQSLAADFLACSSFQFFGPHQGVL